MPVTASTLYNLVQCPQRVAPDAFGDPDRVMRLIHLSAYFGKGGRSTSLK